MVVERVELSYSGNVRSCGIVEGSAQSVYVYVCTYYGPTHVYCGGRHAQQTLSMEKGKDVNLVWTNLRTGKNHSTERGDVPRKLYYNSAVSSTEALRIRTESTQNLHRSFTESAQIFCVEFVEFCKVSCDMYRIHDRKVPLTTAGLYLPPPPPSPQFRSYPVFPMHV